MLFVLFFAWPTFAQAPVSGTYWTWDDGATAGPKFVRYSGTPETHLSAPVGTLCVDSTTGTLYRKISGTGDVGWVAIAVLTDTVAAATNAAQLGGVVASNYLRKDQDVVPDIAGRKIGSPAKPYDGFFGKLSSTLFDATVQQVHGGSETWSKGGGNLAADVAEAATMIDFGQAMMPGDDVEILALDAGGVPKDEHITVGTLVSGTTYNVTRDVLGTYVTDPYWAARTAYAVLGGATDGRVTITAGASPSITAIKGAPSGSTLWRADQNGIAVVPGSSIYGYAPTNGYTFLTAPSGGKYNDVGLYGYSGMTIDGSASTLAGVHIKSNDEGGAGLNTYAELRAETVTAAFGTLTGSLRVGSLGAMGKTGIWATADHVTLSNTYSSHGRTAGDGEWTDIAYNGGHFTASAGSWTVAVGDVVKYRYTLIGSSMVLELWADTTTVTSTPIYLYLDLPAGYTVSGAMSATGFATDTTTTTVTAMRVWAADGATKLALQLPPGWAAGTNGTHVEFTTPPFKVSW